MCQIHRSLRGSYAGAILLHTKLRVAHLDTYLILDLLDAQLGLPVFEFRAHLYRLSGTISEWNVDRDSRALVGRTGIDQLIQCRSVADRGDGLVRW